MLRCFVAMELIGIAEVHAKHGHDLEADSRTHRNRIVRTAIGMPRPPLRRSRLKARIAAAHGTVRVLEQALRAVSSALALGEGDMASCAARQTLVGTRPGIFG